MSRYMNHYYDGLKPYVPGESPQDPNTIKLNTNESPYPPSKGVCGCFTPENAEKLRLYGDPANRQLNRAIAGKDIIAGTFFLAGIDEEDLTDLPDDLAEKYEALFRSPQVFIRSPRGILVLSEDGTQEVIG